MITRSSLSFALLVGSFAIACGGSTDTDANSTGGAAGAGGSGAGGSGGLGGGGSGGLGGGSGGVAGSGGAACSDFLDQMGKETTVRISNKTSGPVFLGGSSDCGPVEVFSIQDPSGAAVQLFAGGCGNTCAQLQEHGDYCTGACMMPALIRINPGGSYDRKWFGTVYEDAAMPTGCYHDAASAPPTCSQRLSAPDGSYAFSAVAASQATCNAGSCDCTPDASGACEILSGGQLGAVDLKAQASLSYPSESLVVVAFQ